MIPTSIFYSYPRAFLPEIDKTEFISLAYVSDRLEWKQDALYGLVDIAQHPSETIETLGGDCVDFARLVASYLYHSTDKDLALYTCWRKNNPPGHMIVYDGENVYSHSAREKESIVNESIPDYLDRTDRRLAIRRNIRGKPGKKLYTN